MQFSGAPVRLLERRIKESEVRPIKDGNLRTPKPNPPKDAKPVKKKVILSYFYPYFVKYNLLISEKNMLIRVV